MLKASASDLQTLNNLRTHRTFRDHTGSYLVEGERFIIMALTTKTVVERVLLVPGRRRSSTLDKLLNRYVAEGGTILSLDRQAFAQVSIAKEPSGIAAVVRQRWSPLQDELQRGLWLCFESVRSPGNLGSVMRTAAAVGATGSIFLGDAIDPHDPVTVRATMGAIFLERFVRTDERALARWRRSGCMVVGTSARAHSDFRKMRYQHPLVLMMGCERHGLSDRQRRLCDVIVKIPMTGRVDSLNLAVASSLMLYEASRSRL